MNKKYLTLSIILVVFCLGASFRPFGCKTTITGTVTDSDDQPVSSAIVRISDNFNTVLSSATTNENGEYTFEDISYGEYTLTVDYNEPNTYNDSLIYTKEISTSYINNGVACKAIDGNIQLGETGGISNNYGCSRYSSLAINTSNNPVVAWQDNTSGNSEIYIRQWNGNNWEEIGEGSASGGGISNNFGNSYYPSLAINNSGNPIVAWCDDTSSNYEVYFKQWDGTSWEEIGGSASGGGISNTSGNSYNPSLAINNSGNPVVAWSEWTSGGEIYLKQWNGSSWEELGGSATGGGISNEASVSTRSGWGNPSLAINGSDNPVVVWIYFPESNNSDIYLKQWNGSSWEELEGSATGGGISGLGWNTSPKLKINGSGNPSVVWAGGGNIYGKYWDGSSWKKYYGGYEEDELNNGYGSSSGPSLAINNSDNVIIAWQVVEHMGHYDNYYILVREDGNWLSIPETKIMGTESSIIDTSLGNFFLAWTSSDSEIYLKQWNGTTWEELGSSASGCVW